MSFLEIFNENVYDLLARLTPKQKNIVSKPQALQVMSDRRSGVKVLNLSKLEMESLSDIEVNSAILLLFNICKY